MFSEVVKIVPRIAHGALNLMLKTLSTRFTSIAKKFGQGIKAAVKLSPFLAIGGAILAKILNPLQKAEEIIDRVLDKGDDIDDTAKELGTDPGKLARLLALGQAKGLDADTMKMLLQKFQGALAAEQEAAKDPNGKVGTLRNFVGEKDTADAFFNFMQSLNKLGETDKSRQVLVQEEIFGEKQRGKAAQLFNTPLNELESILKRLPTAEQFNESIKKTAPLADERDILTAIREADDFINKPALIRDTMLPAIDQSKRNELRSENNNLTRFDAMKQTNIAVQELTDKVDKMFSWMMQEGAPRLITGIEYLGQAFDTITPVLKSFTVDLLAAVDRISLKVKDFIGTIGGYWAEFKSSPLYKHASKLFGGR